MEVVQAEEIVKLLIARLRLEGRVGDANAVERVVEYHVCQTAFQAGLAEARGEEVRRLWKEVESGD